MKLAIYLIISIVILFSGLNGHKLTYWNIWDLIGFIALMISTVMTAYGWFGGKAKPFFSLKRGQTYRVLSSHMQRFNDPNVEDRNYIHVWVDGDVRSFYLPMYKVYGSFADRIESGHVIKWDYVTDSCPFFKKKCVFITNG